MVNNLPIDFLTSAINFDSNVFLNSQILEWLNIIKNNNRVNIIKKPLYDMREWSSDKLTGNVKHNSGKYFTVEGLKAYTNFGNISQWSQPIFIQPEIGFLGFIVKKINNIFHFLVQAKIEPGNINSVQISPTLQATKSNYTQVHKGNKPHYLEYFTGEKKVRVLLDQLQSEHNARFLRKRNRNIVVEIFEDIDLYANFNWLTLGQLKRLIQKDNIINMNTRTVLSGINYNTFCSDTRKDMLELTSNNISKLMLESALCVKKHLNNFEVILSWITFLKTKYTLNVEYIHVNQITDWVQDKGEIYRKDKKHFSITGVSVSIEGREVTNWEQPIITPMQQGLVAFIIKLINGVYHFLVQAKIEIGNFDIIELAPTVQCLVDNYDNSDTHTVPYVYDILSASKKNIHIDTMQSEEGGRFFKEQNRNMIVEVDDTFSNNVPENYCWMTLNQILHLITFNNFFNISARSLISAIEFI